MPELPEVEHVVRGLRRAVAGKQILAVDVNLSRTLAAPAPASFRRKIKGARIAGLRRRGKYIIFDLDTHDILLVHLRMTGKFVLVDTESPLPPYAHVVFYLDTDERLVFCDMRQFGRMRLIDGKQIEALPQIGSLAPEPHGKEFDFEYFWDVVHSSRRSLKQLLLDQTKVLGLGNIYASEALFLARVSPFKAADSLSKPRAMKLHQAVRNILEEAIAAGSTLRVDLTDGIGSYFGTSERFWRVYEREGESCVNCGTKIRRAVQSGRSTYYCPKCQRR
jgi:formamidopyrimidine-DNA glycosylase